MRTAQADVVAPDLGRDEVQIRSATVEDLENLASLDLAAFGDLAYPPFVLRQLFDVHRDCLLVADHASGLLGYSLAAPTLDRSEGWLLALAVRQECRKKGYGERLIDKSLEVLQLHGTSTFYLTVEQNNAPAISLYKKKGFELKEIKKDYLGPGQDRALMVNVMV